MRLGPQRRNLVVWRQSGGSAGRRGAPRPTRTRRLRRCSRLGALLIAVSLMCAARAVRPRWLPLLAGSVLTAAGFTLRDDGLGSVLGLIGVILLLRAPLMQGRPKADRTAWPRSR
jgi:hypothetical protein